MRGVCCTWWCWLLNTCRSATVVPSGTTCVCVCLHECVCLCVLWRGIEEVSKFFGAPETKAAEEGEGGRVTDTQQADCYKLILNPPYCLVVQTAIGRGPGAWDIKGYPFFSVFYKLLTKFLSFTPDLIPHTHSVIGHPLAAAFLY